MPTNISSKAFDTSTYSEIPTVDKEAVLSAIQVIVNNMPDVPVSLKKQHLLDGMLWTFTEGQGRKFKWKCRYRSESVLNKDVVVDIQHDHVYTRAFLKDRILNEHALNLNNFLLQHCFACLLSKEEHKLIPRNSNGFSKYKNAGIKIYDILEGKWM